MIRRKGMESSFGLMEENIEENGIMASKMVKGLLLLVPE